MVINYLSAGSKDRAFYHLNPKTFWWQKLKQVRRVGYVKAV